MIETRKLDSIPDARAYLGGLGRSKLYELAKAGDVTVVKVGTRAFITRESLDAYVERITEAAGERHGGGAS